MGIERSYNFACDYCGYAECFLADNIKDAKDEARLEGWKIHGKRGCFCSEECYIDGTQGGRYE